MRAVSVSVSVIIPTYNDTAQLPVIVDAALQLAEVKEVIIVDDGSDAQHWPLLSQMPRLGLGVVVLRHETNRGKAAAMKTGLLQATGEVVCFLDADLVDLTAKDVRHLVAPILEGEYDLTISKRGRGIDKLLSYLGYSQALSGERAARRQLLLQNIDIFDAVGYGVEVAMNQRFFTRFRVALVPLPHVSQQVKTRKFSLRKALVADTRSICQTLRTVGLKEVIQQTRQARSLPTVK